MSLPEPIRVALGEGLRLEAEGGQLKVRGPKEVVGQVLPLLKTYKTEILHRLESVDRLIAKAVEGLPITPETLRAELAPEDLEDMTAGSITPEELRAFAQIIAERRAADEEVPAGASGDSRPPEQSHRDDGEGTHRTPEELAEAREERAAIHEHEGGLPREEADRLAELFEAFYGHLMGPGVRENCCYAPADRYCLTGKRLRDEYYASCRRTGRLN